MSLIFIGSGKFAAIVLNYLANTSPVSIKLVITHPDSYIGRRKSILHHDECKLTSNTHQLPVYETLTITSVEDKLKEINPNFIIVCSFSELIPQNILQIPQYCCLNIHPSLLPKYRGSTPIQTALYNGDSKTGISIIKMNNKLDAGEIVLQQKEEILLEDSFESLSEKLANLSGPLIENAMIQILDNKTQLTAQCKKDIVYCKKFTDRSAHISFNGNAKAINDKIKGLNPDPGAYILYNYKHLKILEAGYSSYQYQELIGTIIRHNTDIGIVCKEGLLILHKVQLEGKKAMNIQEFVRGRPSFIGYRIS